MDDWIPITSKFANKCITCGNMVEVGDSVLWKKGSGIRHNPVCEEENTGIQEDNSALIIIDNDEWKDFEKYSHEKLQTIINCQCCGKSLNYTKDRFTNDDKRVCQECFMK